MNLFQEFFSNPIKRTQPKEAGTRKPSDSMRTLETPPQNDDHNSSAGEQMVWHVIEQSGLPEVAAQISCELDAQGITDPRVRGEVLIAGLRAAMTPSWRQRLVSLFCRTSGSLRNRLVERITGIRLVDLNQLADDLFTERGQQRFEQQKRDEEEIIRQAWESSAVQGLATEIGLRRDHLRDVYDRLVSHGHLLIARRAISDVRLLRWYYEHGGKDKLLGPDETIQLWTFARDGNLE